MNLSTEKLSRLTSSPSVIFVLSLLVHRALVIANSNSSNTSSALINETATLNKIHKFVISGGPCSGKTTALERIQSFLRERGFRVFTVPEAATILFLNGASPDDLVSTQCQQAFQQFVIQTQMTLEDRIYKYAESTNQKCILLCDRGIMDGSAYVDDDIWTHVLEFAGLDKISAREGRYDAVFHLVTAADGAPNYYTLANNRARSETIDDAKAIDKRTQTAWSGHPHHVIIDNDNGKSFDKKIQQLIGILSSYVGLPSLTKRSYKYLIESPSVNGSILSFPINYQVFDVEKVMMSDKFRSSNSSIAGDHSPSDTHKSLDRKELYSFLRRRSQGNMHSYAITTVEQLPSGEVVELKQNITRRVYDQLSKVNACKDRNKIIETRYSFLWEKQSFTMIENIVPREGLWTMRIQCEGEPKIPPFLKVIKEIKEDDKEYSSYNVSLKSQLRTHSPFTSISAAATTDDNTTGLDYEKVEVPPKPSSLFDFFK